MAKQEPKKALFKITADNTNMVRYITGMTNFSDHKHVVRVKAQLRSTEGSSIGNAAHYRINPLWKEHRRLFLSAKSYKVEKLITFDEVVDGKCKRQHFVAELNRAALKAASHNLMVA